MTRHEAIIILKIYSNWKVGTKSKNAIHDIRISEDQIYSERRELIRIATRRLQKELGFEDYQTPYLLNGTVGDPK